MVNEIFPEFQKQKCNNILNKILVELIEHIPVNILNQDPNVPIIELQYSAAEQPQLLSEVINENPKEEIKKELPLKEKF